MGLLEGGMTAVRTMFALAIFLVIPVLIFLFRNGYRKRREAGKVFGISARKIKWNHLVRASSAVLLLLSLAAYFFFPIFQGTKNEKFMTADVIFLADVSWSMGAEKVPGTQNRLERTSEIMLRVLDESPDIKLKLCAFTRIVRCHQGFTPDHSEFRETVENVLGIESVPRTGSDLMVALAETADMFPEDSKSKVIILFSDGEYRPPYKFVTFPEAIKSILDKDIRLIVVGVGEKDGARMPVYDKGSGELSGFASDYRGEPIITHLNEQFLMEIALKTGGAYFYETDWQGALNVLKNSLIEQERTVPNPSSRYGKYLLILSLAPLLFVITKNW